MATLLSTLGLSNVPAAQNAAAANAAAANLYGLNATQAYEGYGNYAADQLARARDASLDYLRTGQTGALDANRAALETLSGVSTDPLRAALTTVQGVSTDPLRAAVAASAGGGGAAMEAGQNAVTAFNPLRDLGASYQPAVDAYYRSLGLAPGGTPEFALSPGQQFTRDQALKAATYGAAAGGTAGTGTLLDRLTKLGADYGNQFYGDWQNRLASFLPLQASAVSGTAAGQSGAFGRLADIGLTSGQNLAATLQNLFTGGRATAGDIANAYNALYSGERARAGDIAGGYGQIASTYGQYAPLMSGVTMNAAGQLVDARGNVVSGTTQAMRDVTGVTTAGNQAIANAGQADTSNLFGLLGAGVRAAGSIYGGGAGVPRS